MAISRALLETILIVLGFDFLITLFIGPYVFGILFILAISLLYSGPMICLFLSLQISIRLIKNCEFTSTFKCWHAFGIISWIGAYLVAWRYALIK
jgi:hypothetical protein